VRWQERNGRDGGWRVEEGELCEDDGGEAASRAE